MLNRLDQSSVFVIASDETTCTWIDRVLGPKHYRTRRFPTVLSFLEQFDPSIPGCVLADFKAPDGGTWDLVDVTQGEPPGVQLIFMVDGINVPTVVELMKAGVCDIIVRPVSDEVLQRSIERATDIDIQHKLEFAAQSATRKHYTMLTPREREIFQLVVSGLPSKGIARVLDRSQKTVEVHRTSIMKKMAARSVVELVRMGIELRVLDGQGAGASWKPGSAPKFAATHGGLPPMKKNSTHQDQDASA